MIFAALVFGGAAWAGSCCVAGANGDPLWLLGEEVAAAAVKAAAPTKNPRRLRRGAMLSPPSWRGSPAQS